jgi:hypothetical protein
MAKHQCEWCEKTAHWMLVCGTEYKRYSCEGHFDKTRRQSQLDGYDTGTYVGRSDGFVIDNVAFLDPHHVSRISCERCQKEWIATYPAAAKKLECPACGTMTMLEAIE